MSNAQCYSSRRKHHFFKGNFADRRAVANFKSGLNEISQRIPQQLWTSHEKFRFFP